MRAPGARKDRRIDPDQPTRHVNKRSTGVTGIDGSIGLDKHLRVATADLAARQRRNDPLCHRLSDAERIADRQHHVADFQPVAVLELQRRQPPIAAFDLQDSNVGFFILQQHLGIELAFVREHDPDLGIGADLHHVRIGHHHAIGR